MTLILKNLQNIVRFNTKLLEKQINLIRSIFQVQKFDVGVICIDNEEIQTINRTYRHSDQPTDVLAFPYFENLEPGVLPSPLTDDDYNLGDLYLGLPYIKEQCDRHKEQLEQTLPVMVTHGFCHLLGFDHETKEQWQTMYKRESDVLKEFNKLTGLQCKPLLGIGHEE